jgi:hypothetical protein
MPVEIFLDAIHAGDAIMHRKKVYKWREAFYNVT